MAELVETIDRDGRKIAIYDNGMERDVERGRIVKPPSTTMITSENASEYYRRRQEKKRERAQAGANAALAKMKDEEGNPIYDAVDEDFIEAIAESQTELALSGNAYSTRAAEFIISLTGYGERGKADEPAQQTTDLLNAASMLLVLLSGKQEVQIRATDGEVVEAES